MNGLGAILVIGNSVKLYDVFSLLASIPQDSIIRPLLFIVYLNDIERCSNLLSFILFADDTNPFMSSNDIYQLCDSLNAESIKVLEWFSI